MIVEGKVTEIYGFIGHFGKDFANIKGKHKKTPLIWKKSMVLSIKDVFQIPKELKNIL